MIGQQTHIRAMKNLELKNLELSDAEAAALVRLLREAIDADHFPLSPRVQVWLGILGKLTLKPEPARQLRGSPGSMRRRREGGIGGGASEW